MPDSSAAGLTADTIRTTANRVMQSGEFENSLSRPAFSEARKWLAEILDRLYEPVASMGSALESSSPLLYWITISVLVLVLLGLLFHIFYSLRLSLKRQSLDAVKIQPLTEMTPEELARQAGEYAKQRDYAFALRLLLRSALLSLGGGKIRRCATNRECIRNYRQSPAAVPLRVLVNLVEYKWFGSQECLEPDWRKGLRAHRDILAHVHREVAEQQQLSQEDELLC